MGWQLTCGVWTLSYMSCSKGTFHLETTLSGMHMLISTIIYDIPHLLSKNCQIIREQLLVVPAW